MEYFKQLIENWIFSPLQQVKRILQVKTIQKLSWNFFGEEMLRNI